MIRQLIEATGFATAARQGADAAALDGHVKEIVRGIVTDAAPFVPLGRLGLSLRNLYSSEINEGSFADVVNALEQIRAQQPPAPTGSGMPGEAPLPLGMPGESPLPTDPTQAPGAPLPETPGL